MTEENKEQKPKEKKKPAPQEFQPKVEKKAWTVDRCMKAARRFKDETSWSVGAPSSYKSAQAHGWVNQCLAAMLSGGKSGKAVAGKKNIRAA